MAVGATWSLQLVPDAYASVGLVPRPGSLSAADVTAALAEGSGSGTSAHLSVAVVAVTLEAIASSRQPSGPDRREASAPVSRNPQPASRIGSRTGSPRPEGTSTTARASSTTHAAGTRPRQRDREPGRRVTGGRRHARVLAAGVVGARGCSWVLVGAVLRASGPCWRRTDQRQDGPGQQPVAVSVGAMLAGPRDRIVTAARHEVGW